MNFTTAPVLLSILSFIHKHPTLHTVGPEAMGGPRYFVIIDYGRNHYFIGNLSDLSDDEILAFSEFLSFCHYLILLKTFLFNFVTYNTYNFPYIVMDTRNYHTILLLSIRSPFSIGMLDAIFVYVFSEINPTPLSDMFEHRKIVPRARDRNCILRVIQFPLLHSAQCFGRPFSALVHFSTSPHSTSLGLWHLAGFG